MGIKNKKIFLFVLSLVFFFIPVKALAQEFPVAVTVGSTSKPISPFIWGVDYNGYSTYSSADEFIAPFGGLTRLKNLGVTMLRYPGGCPSDVYNWKTNEMKGRNFLPAGSKFLSVDEFLKLTGVLQAEPLYTINVNYKIVGNPCGDVPEYPGLSADQNKQILIQDAADLVRAYKGRIKYFELGNEQNLTGYTPAEYQAIALPIAQAMKNVDPTIQIGLISFFDYSTNHSQPVPWSNMVKSIVNSACGTVACFDYVSTHDYFGVAYGSNIVPYAPLLKHQYGFANATLDFAPKKIAMTEWNTGNCWEEKAGLSSVFWGMFYEEMLLTMAEKGVFIANYHDITGGSQCSLIEPSDANRSPEQVFSLSSVLAGGNLLATSTNSPTTTISLNSSLTIYAAGTPVAGVYPSIGLNINGVRVAQFDDIRGDPSNRVFQSYTYRPPTPISASAVTVELLNDAYNPPEDRNVIIDKINLDGVDYQSEDPSTYSTGTWSPDTNCAPGYKQSEWINCSGYLQFSGSIISSAGESVPDVTAHSGYSSDGKSLYIFLINHHQSQNANISLNLNAVSNYLKGSIRVDQLTAPSLTSRAFTQSGNTIAPTNPLSIIISSNSIVRLTLSPLSGDFSGDRHVNDTDYDIIKKNFGKPYTIYDYNRLVENFGK